MENFDETKRTYNTKVREPWNPVIKTCLDAIDRHMSLYLDSGCIRHLQQAELLREYVAGLKEWVRSEEIKGGCGGGNQGEG
jgi:hypothetical protein